MCDRDKRSDMKLADVSILRILLEASVHNDMQRLLNHLRRPSAMTRRLSKELQDSLNAYRKIREEIKSIRFTGND